MADLGLMTMTDIAERVGVKLDSVHRYHTHAVRRRRDGEPRPGDLPAPDGQVGRTPVWLPETVEAWAANRPGQGANAGIPRPGRRKSA